MKYIVIVIQVVLIPLGVLVFVREILNYLIDSHAEGISMLNEIARHSQPDVGIVMQISQYDEEPVKLIMRAESDPTEHITLSLPGFSCSDYVIFDRVPLRRFPIPFPDAAALKKMHIPLDESGMLIPEWEYERLQAYLHSMRCRVHGHRRIPSLLCILCALILLPALLMMVSMVFSNRFWL